VAEPTTPTPAPELPKPRRFLNPDEAVAFLGLRSRSALAYLHRGENPPPCVMLSVRNRVYDLADLQAWADARKRR
jgi:predicted DNA-binding transcriptional regulator AlpA